MAPTQLPAPRWRRTRERMLADRLLDLQDLRGELADAFAHVRYLDAGEQAALDDFLAVCALAAPVERRFQPVVERHVAIVEGRVPPGSGGASARARRAA